MCLKIIFHMSFKGIFCIIFTRPQILCGVKVAPLQVKCIGIAIEYFYGLNEPRHA
jgi:hypothetical protein